MLLKNQIIFSFWFYLS